MIYPDIKDAVEIHNDIIENIGGKSGYNEVSIGYLDSALEHVRNDEFYPEFLDKITHIVFSCVKFHPFLDGNKRTAIQLGIYFLELNGMDGYFVHFASIMEDAVVDLADNKISKDQLKNIISNIIY